MKEKSVSPTGLIFLVLFGLFCTACVNDPGRPSSTAAQIWVSGVSIAREDFTLKAGMTKKLEVTVSPENASDRGLEFQSNDPAIAGVDSNGLVTGKSAGDVYITAIAADGSGVMDTVHFTIIRADTGDASVLWDWIAGDDYMSGADIRGKRVLTLEGDVSLDDKGRLTLKNNGRFSVGTADITPTTVAFMPGDGAFDLSGTTKIAINYITSPAGTFDIFVNNNTTIRGNSVLGNNSRIYNNRPVAGKIESLIVDEYMGNNIASLKNAFLQFRISGTGGSITISSIAVTREGKESITPEDLIVQSIDPGEDFSLAVGDSKQINFNVAPVTARNKQLAWTSSNGAVAAVSSGYVQALGPGTADITAAAQDGSNISARVGITVNGPARENIQPIAARIFNRLKGQAVTTKGWADIANDGAGLSYTNPASYTLLDDGSYPSAGEKLTAFKNALAQTAPAFIIVSGDIDLSEGRVSDIDHSYYDDFNPMTRQRSHGDITLNITSNTTIIGIYNARIKYGGLRINNQNNVIIRNITFYDAHGSTEYDTSAPGYGDSKASIDVLVIQGSSNGVWVDHCTFTDGVCNDLIRNYNHDGAFDIPQGKNVTVSWCEFTNHDKVMLVAGSDSLTNPPDRQITLHHNYFHDGVTQRMPRSRGTQMHIYNNYYNNIGVPGNNGYSLGPGIGSQFIVENNYFSSHLGQGGNGIIKYFDSSASSSVVTFSRFYHSGNIPQLTASHCTYDSVESLRDFNAHVAAEKPWVIPYAYTPESAGGLITSIPHGAGIHHEIDDL